MSKPDCEICGGAGAAGIAGAARLGRGPCTTNVHAIAATSNRFTICHRIGAPCSKHYAWILPVGAAGRTTATSNRNSYANRASSVLPAAGRFVQEDCKV